MLPGDFQLPRPSIRLLLAFGVLGLVGLVGSIVSLAVTVFVISAWFGLPLGFFGLNEGPDQPIDFPHTVHVEELGLDCTFCHRNVTIGAAATVPAVGLCMTCHKTVGDGKAEVEKLRQIYGEREAIDWVRVHRVPDHVHFVHEAHIRFFSGTKTIVETLTDPERHIRLGEARRIEPDARVGGTMEIAVSQTCSICHGNVAGMTKVEQVRPLKMSDCVNCHRDNSAPADCATCHY